MPISKSRARKLPSKPRKTRAPAVLPDRRAMESFLAAIAGRRGDNATAKAQDVMYEAWERTRYPHDRGNSRLSSQQSLLSSLMGCAPKVRFARTLCWREPDSNPRSRKMGDRFETAFRRLRGFPFPKRAHPLATGDRGFESRSLQRRARHEPYGC